MAHYTKLNLRSDVEDMAKKFGYSPDVESHFARTPLGLEESGLSLFRVAPGFRMPFGHRHERQEEVYVVVAGSARVKVEEEIVELRQWDALRLPGPVWRGFEAGPDGVELLAFGAPNTENKDVEMQPGWWAG
jgi:mannose-6-phosphate isomerase-like protein (cupin superfamily)